MDLTVESNALKDLLVAGATGIILLPDTATQDAVAAALALYLSLKLLNKQITIVYPKPPLVGLSHLVGINKLTQSVGNKNFVISLDYTEGSIEKVSYNIEGNKFNLVIEPRGGHVFDQKGVSYAYSGITADFIIVIEAVTPDLLGKFYVDNKNLFTEKPVVVVDNRISNTQWGKINFVRPAASISEIVTHIIKSTEMPIDIDISSNLYDGLVSGSRNFSSPIVNADTFEAAAWVLRKGAKKVAVQEERPHQEFAVSTGGEAPQTPPDWLKPKIYKGSQLL